MLVQIYLTSQAGLTETGTGGEPYGLRRLVQRKGLSGGWGEEGGEKIFLGGERHPRTTLLSFDNQLCEIKFLCTFLSCLKALRKVLVLVYIVAGL